MSHVEVLASDSVRNLVMPISVRQYHEMSATGMIAEKTELVEGIVFRKMTQSPLHTYVVNKLQRFFDARIGDDELLRKEDPLTLANSEPEPDLAIVKGSLESFARAHPDHAELVIEVAIATLELDRAKAVPYAAAGIPEYWIVRPADQLLERYREPSADVYRQCEVLNARQSIETRWGRLELRSLLDTDTSD